MSLTAFVMLALAVAVGIALAPYVLPALGWSAAVLLIGLLAVAVFWIVRISLKVLKAAGVSLTRWLGMLVRGYASATAQSWEDVVGPARDAATRAEAFLTLFSRLVLAFGVAALLVAVF